MEEHLGAKLDALRFQPLGQPEVVEQRQNFLHVDREGAVKVEAVESRLELLLALLRDAECFLVIQRQRGRRSGVGGCGARGRAAATMVADAELLRAVCAGAPVLRC